MLKLLAAFVGASTAHAGQPDWHGIWSLRDSASLIVEHEPNGPRRIQVAGRLPAVL